MNNYLARISPEWRDIVNQNETFIVISPKTRQVGEIKIIKSKLRVDLGEQNLLQKEISSNAKYRQEHGHAVYVSETVNSNKKWGVNNEVSHKLGHGVQVKDVIENEDRTTIRK